jgi:hypothetical protein
LTVCAVTSGAEGWLGLADFGKEKLEWLRRFVPLKNGIPSHDCIAYTLSSTQKNFAAVLWIGLMR